MRISVSACVNCLLEKLCRVLPIKVLPSRSSTNLPKFYQAEVLPKKFYQSSTNQNFTLHKVAYLHQLSWHSGGNVGENCLSQSLYLRQWCTDMEILQSVWMRNLFINSISKPYPTIKNYGLQYPIQIQNYPLSCTLAKIFGKVYFAFSHTQLVVVVM